MRSATARALSLGLLLAAGCKPSPHRPDAQIDAPPEIDAFQPAWWTPEPGEILDWDIQLARTPFDVTTTQRAMYMIDLFDAVPEATMLDYGDGGPLLTVPAGAHATAIAQLHATTPRTFVVCHVNTGAIRLDDPDAMKFPGYAANPPNRPTTPATGSVIGWSTSDTDLDERFIDTGLAARSKVLPLVDKRFELAKQIGCDAVAASHNDAVAYEGSSGGHGFADITPEVIETWAAEMTTRAHTRVLSVGVRNARQQTIDAEVAVYDWALVDRCGEQDGDCELQRPFINLHKAVFAVEYTLDQDGNPNNPDIVCGRHGGAAMITGGIIKTAALDSTPPMRCPVAP